MSRSKTIILNTGVTYARSVLGLGLALFSSRWVLQALGQSDFGLFNVVGALIVFVTFLNTVMAASAARYFAFAIGEGRPSEVRQWFNTALSVHIVMAICLVVIGLPIGEYVVSHFISIPEGRAETAHWIFRISLVTAFFSMVSVPFVGMFTASQKIAELAVIGMLQTAGSFILAFTMTRIQGDRLLFYSICSASILILIQILTIGLAYRIFRECKLSLSDWFNWARIRKIGSFAGWNLIGALGGTLQSQGSALLLNIQFGTKVNAAYGISNQVSVATNQLSAAMMGAFAPEITRSEGEGDRNRMLLLAQRANKFGTILVLLFAIPLFIEMDLILTLWLRTVPEHTAMFCRLMLIMFLFDRLTNGYMLAVAAHGRIAAYQMTLGGILLLSLPIAWLLLKFGWPAPSVVAASALTMLFCSVGRVLWVNKLFGISGKIWIVKTLVPCLLIAISSSLVGCGVIWLMPASVGRLALVLCVTLLTSVCMAWVVATDGSERERVVNILQRIFPKKTASSNPI
jgi:O-antigen/teichoic acid export membrane protein